jgi:hypothetical protein
MARDKNCVIKNIKNNQKFGPPRYEILEDNLSRDFLYQMLNIEYPYVNKD